MWGGHRGASTLPGGFPAKKEKRMADIDELMGVFRPVASLVAKGVGMERARTDADVTQEWLVEKGIGLWSKVDAPDQGLAKGAGEGSRGGHVVGHTKSGKPIYGHEFGKTPTVAKIRADHPDYTSQDHEDAAKHFESRKEDYTNEKGQKMPGANRFAGESKQLDDIAAAHRAVGKQKAGYEHNQPSGETNPNLGCPHEDPNYEKHHEAMSKKHGLDVRENDDGDTMVSHHGSEHNALVYKTDRKGGGSKWHTSPGYSNESDRNLETGPHASMDAAISHIKGHLKGGNMRDKVAKACALQAFCAETVVQKSLGVEPQKSSPDPGSDRATLGAVALQVLCAEAVAQKG